MVNLILLESDRQIQKKIYTAIKEEINKSITKNQNKVLKQIQNKIPFWIASQPEIAELQKNGVPGSLSAQLGLLPGQGHLATADIIDAIVSSIQVEIKPLNTKLQGGIIFSVQPSNFRELLRLPSGFSITSKGVALPWLEWLLTLGATTIVFGYTYVPGSSGRSGGGSMEAGGIWRIPPEFSGVAIDNFITRSLDGRDRELAIILGGMFT